MPKRASSLDPRAERVRSAMKRAAFDLAMERRIEAISVTDIVERAGVSRPAFYQHFRDRDDAVVVSVVEALRARVEDGQSAGSADPEARLRRMLAFVMEHRKLYGNLHPSAASQQCSEAMRRELLPVLEQYARVARKRRIFPLGGARADVSTFLLGGFSELLRQWNEENHRRRAVDPMREAERLIETLRELLCLPRSR